MDENKKMEMRDVSRLLEESYVSGSGNAAARQKGGQDSLKDARGNVREEISYPGLEEIGEDPAALKIIAPAYAGGEGELTAVLQYIYQHIIFENSGYPEYADALLKISLEEMKHLGILGSLICKLGAPPVYSYLPPYPINYYCARSVSYSKTPQKMILDDIQGEQYAIDSYGKMLCRLKDERVAAVIQRIRMDEEKHLAEFKRILKELTEGK